MDAQEIQEALLDVHADDIDSNTYYFVMPKVVVDVINKDRESADILGSKLSNYVTVITYIRDADEDIFEHIVDTLPAWLLTDVNKYPLRELACASMMYSTEKFAVHVVQAILRELKLPWLEVLANISDMYEVYTAYGINEYTTSEVGYSWNPDKIKDNPALVEGLKFDWNHYDKVIEKFAAYAALGLNIEEIAKAYENHSN